MDMEKLMQKHPNVSGGELEKIRETSNFLNRSENFFVKIVQLLDMKKENEKTNGRISVEAGPLVQVLSVHVLPSDKLIDQNKPLTTYGRIYAEYRDTSSEKTIVHDLFSRSSDDAQVLGPSGGPLTLFGPDYPCRRPFKRCRRFNITRLVVDVFIGEGNNLFAEKQLCCGYEEDLTIDLENIKLEYVHGELGSLAVRYIAMPLAVYGHVEVEFLYKLLDGENRSLNVKGKIVARYGNNSWTLFDKQNDNEFEHMENKQKLGKVGEARMRLSRCLVGVPVYSSLILDLDLSEFGTGRKFLKETVLFRVQNEVSQDQFLVDDDILIRVLVGWKSSSPRGRQELSDDDESSGDEMLSDDDEQMDDEASCDLVASPSNRSLPWSLYPITACTLSFVEIFSVFIGREKYKPLQVYGSIKVAYDVCTFYVFKREAKEDAFGLSEHSKTLPLLDGSRVFNEGNSLEMKIDLKDVESQLHIKGYVCWDTRSLASNFSPWLDKQLCSVIQGEHGDFAAIHYTIFSDEAEYADVKLLCIPKNGGHFCPKVYGSLVAQYNNYDYTSRYNRDYYRIVLFQRNRDDAAQPGPDGFIPLSRYNVVVPKSSSLIIEANIGDGLSDELYFQELEFCVSTTQRKLIMERNYYSIYIYVRLD